jgi:hypothetical protein
MYVTSPQRTRDFPAADRADRAAILSVEDQHVADRKSIRAHHDVNTLRQVQEGPRGGVLEVTHGVHPRAGRVDHATRAGAEAALREAAGGLDARGLAAFPNDRVHRGVTEDCGAESRRGAKVGQHQVGIVSQVLAIHAGLLVHRSVEEWLLALEIRLGPVAMAILTLHCTELLVGDDSGAHLEQTGAGTHRNHHPAAHRQMRSDPEDLLALEGSGADQGDVAHGEITQSAVNQPRGATGGARCEVLRLDHRHRQTPQRSPPPRSPPPTDPADTPRARPRRPRSRPRSPRSRSAPARDGPSSRRGPSRRWRGPASPSSPSSGARPAP